MLSSHDAGSPCPALHQSSWCSDRDNCWRPWLQIRPNSHSSFIVTSRRLPGDHHCLFLRRTKDTRPMVPKQRALGPLSVKIILFHSLLTLLQFVQWVSSLQWSQWSVKAAENTYYFLLYGHQYTSKWNPILYLVNVPGGKARANSLSFLTAAMLFSFSISTWRANSIKTSFPI